MMVVVFISRVRQKILFALRLFLLLVILTVLTTQIYALVKPHHPSGARSHVTTSTRPAQGEFLDNLVGKLKNYYRGR